MGGIGKHQIKAVKFKQLALKTNKKAKVADKMLDDMKPKKFKFDDVAFMDAGYPLKEDYESEAYLTQHKLAVMLQANLLEVDEAIKTLNPYVIGPALVKVALTVFKKVYVNSTVHEIAGLVNALPKFIGFDKTGTPGLSLSKQTSKETEDACNVLLNLPIGTGMTPLKNMPDLMKILLHEIEHAGKTDPLKSALQAAHPKLTVTNQTDQKMNGVWHINTVVNEEGYPKPKTDNAAWSGKLDGSVVMTVPKKSDATTMSVEMQEDLIEALCKTIDCLTGEQHVEATFLKNGFAASGQLSKYAMLRCLALIEVASMAEPPDFTVDD